MWLMLTYMHVSVDYLVVDNKLVCSALGKPMSPTLSVPLMPVDLCIELRPHGLSPVHFDMPIIAAQSLIHL